MNQKRTNRQTYEIGVDPMGRSKDRFDDGQSLVIVAILLVVLIGMLALVLDGGYAYMQRRAAQTAADAGALAGAAVLCETGDANQAVSVALEYAIDRNGAQGANVVVEAGVVTVDTEITFSTFFGRIFSRAQITAAAIAAAKCIPAGGAEGVLPIGWNCPPGEATLGEDGIWHCGLEYGPSNPYIIMNSRKTSEESMYCLSEGGTVDCDIDNDGVEELLVGGNRSWLDLNGSGHDAGNGSAELRFWIENGYPHELPIHTFVAGQPGVSTSTFSSVETRLLQPVLLPVYNAISHGIPDLPYDDESDQVIVSNGSSTTYYHIIAFSIFIPTCVKDKGNDHCNLHDQFVAQGILKHNDKSIEGYFVKGTSDGVDGGGSTDAGVYVLSLIR